MPTCPGPTLEALDQPTRDLEVRNWRCNYHATTLPPDVSDPEYGTLKWTWTRAGGICPGGDPERSVPAWTHSAGQYSTLKHGGRWMSAVDYLVLKSLRLFCGTPITPTTPTPTRTIRQYVGTLPTGQEAATMPTIYTGVPSPTSYPTSMGFQPTMPGGPIISPGPGPVTSTVPWSPINGGGTLSGPIQTILGGATDWLTRQLFGGGGSGGTGGGETTTSPGTTVTGYGLTGPCPTGYELRNGRCEKVGVVGTIQRILPGGETGYLPATGGGIMPGGVAPSQLSTTRSVCPRGMVLGFDGWCYHKAAISNKQRKYPRGRRPLLTGGEMKTLTRARSLENKVKRAWQAAGKPGQTRCRRK